jgi:hypothetical protein
VAKVKVRAGIQLRAKVKSSQSKAAEKVTIIIV